MAASMQVSQLISLPSFCIFEANSLIDTHTSVSEDSLVIELCAFLALWMKSGRPGIISSASNLIMMHLHPFRARTAAPKLPSVLAPLPAAGPSTVLDPPELERWPSSTSSTICKGPARLGNSSACASPRRATSRSTRCGLSCYTGASAVASTSSSVTWQERCATSTASGGLFGHTIGPHLGLCDGTLGDVTEFQTNQYQYPRIHFMLHVFYAFSATVIMGLLSGSGGTWCMEEPPGTAEAVEQASMRTAPSLPLLQYTRNKEGLIGFSRL